MERLIPRKTSRYSKFSVPWFRPAQVCQVSLPAVAAITISAAWRWAAFVVSVVSLLLLALLLLALLMFVPSISMMEVRVLYSKDLRTMDKIVVVVVVVVLNLLDAER